MLTTLFTAKFMRLGLPLMATMFILNCGTQTLSKKEKITMTDSIQPEKLDTAVLGGGCFWCLDAVYRRMKGIVSSESGYANGNIKNPTYREVCSGLTGHAEVVKLVFDTSVTSFAEVLEVFWRIHNPTTLNKQGNDVGTQYRSGIYYMNEQQRDLAIKSRDAVKESKLWEGDIITEIVPLNAYYPAEDYHQDYYSINPDQPYCVYVVGEKVEKFKKAFKDKVRGNE
jgi:peptide-methionine (S)-S-oxide reductase